MISVEELEDVLQLGHETAGFEFKGPGTPDDTRFFAKIARAALSLGNLRDGGHILIGIDDEAPAELGPGLEEEQLTAWLDYDTVASRLAVYAAPPLDFGVAARTFSNGATIVVLHVKEFADVPHLCAKAYDPVLRAGALYVRPRRLPETIEVAGPVEMRDVLDLAVEKGLRRFVQTASRAGVLLAEDGPTDREKFDRERDEAWG